MPSVQTSKSSKDNNKNAQRGKSKNQSRELPERDEDYNLVSVLYHALQGAEAALKYQSDAEKSGDERLLQFFESTQQGYTRFAQQAKQLLASRLEVDADDEEESVDEEDDEDDDAE